MSRGRDLLFQVILALIGLDEKAVDAFKLAFDALFIHDTLDLVDGLRVALHGQPGFFESVPLDYPVYTVVDRIGDMSGRSAGLAATDPAIIEQDDLNACLGQEIRRS